MAKNNNKGFSLIEIIIAIAILTLLLTPILKQFTQTLEINRKAKEQQYVNENASYILEYTQKADLGTLSVDASVKDVATDLSKASAETVYNDVNCKIYNVDGTQYATGSDGLVKYNATIYSLNDVKLGAKKNVYHRNVVADDLAMKLMSKKTGSGNADGLQVAYDLTEDDLANFAGEGDFELTNEGSIVEYDANGLVKSIVCEELVDASGNKFNVDNPNETNLFNMQDIDHTKVALITGNAASFDAQAETAFYSMAMDNLKKENPESWEQGLTHIQGENILSTGAFGDTVIKLTKIYVNKVDGKYVVKVDVFYQNDYTLTGSTWYHDTLNYNVLTQTFNTNECPAVYFEYQPYTAESTSSSARYGKQDYILIDNYVEGAKLYLYQPAADQLNVMKNRGVTDPVYNTEGVYYTTASSSDKVVINLMKTNSDVKDMEIYTNLHVCSKDTEYLEVGGTPVGISGSKIENINGVDTTYVFQEFRAYDGESIVKKNVTYAGTSTIVNLFEDALTDERLLSGSTHTYDTITSRSGYNIKMVKGIDQDERFKDRALTITVRLVPAGNNYSMSTITLTGAKGVN